MQQLNLFDLDSSDGQIVTDSATVPNKPAAKLVRPSHPVTSHLAAIETEKNLTKAIIFALGWVEEALSDPKVSDVTSYEVDELATRDFRTYRGFDLPDRVCGKRFGDLKDLGLIHEVGNRESLHREFRGGRGLVECFELTEKGRAQVQEQEKWWLNMTAREYGHKAK